MIYLDTHVVAWLYAGRVDLLPRFARALIDGNELLVSPIVALELQNEMALSFCDLSFADVAQAACEETWTGDPFDRIVVAHARIRSVPLVTKDRVIRRRFAEAVWDRPRG